MSVGIDYEFRRPFDGSRIPVVAPLSGDIQIEYNRLSVDRIIVSVPLPPRGELTPDFVPFTELTLYVQPEGGERMPFARGWLMRRIITPTLAVYEFGGARRLLNLVSVQAIFTPTQTIDQAVNTIIQRAKAVLASTTNGVNITDWEVRGGFDRPAPFLQMLAPTTATYLIEELEHTFGNGLVVTFGFSPSSTSAFQVRAQGQPQEIVLLDGQVNEWDEQYDRIVNRIRFLMSNPVNRNAIPNPDFADVILSSSGGETQNLVPNPSFETMWADWVLPPYPDINYSWEWNYGYTGNYTFFFDDCHEYSAQGWLTSGVFPVTPGLQYAGGFALGCSPNMAQECGGPSTVKVRVQIQGFDSANALTETAYDAEITGIFHSEAHWHWIPIPPFRFANSATVQARIRFNTYHGKRLYLDEVQVYRPYQAIQRHWLLQPDSGSPPLQLGTHYDIDWMRPIGVSEGKHVWLSLSLPSGRWIELQSDIGSLSARQSSYTVTLFSSGSTPAVYVDWYNEQGNFVSTTIALMNVQDNVDEDNITWTRYTSQNLSVPAGSVAARVRLRWQAVSGETRIRCVLLAPSAENRPYRYGYAVSAEYRAGNVIYTGDADTELKAEAQDSETVFGVLPVVRQRDSVVDAMSGEMQAAAEFLQFAVPERRIEVSGADLDWRLLYPHRYRLRIPTVLARTLVLQRLVIHPGGQWEATLGSSPPDLSNLLHYLLVKSLEQQ